MGRAAAIGGLNRSFFFLGKSLKLSKEAHNAPKSFHGFMCINDKAIVLSASKLYTVRKKSSKQSQALPLSATWVASHSALSEFSVKHRCLNLCDMLWVIASLSRKANPACFLIFKSSLISSFSWKHFSSKFQGLLIFQILVDDNWLYPFKMHSVSTWSIMIWSKILNCTIVLSLWAVERLD